MATDKRVQVATASLSGDQRDNWGAGGLSSYSLAWSTGHLETRTTDASVIDADQNQNDGQFNKLSFAASRLQQATRTLSFGISLSGQMASRNLDVSEQMALGGMYGVRAYPEGEAYGDEGYLLTLEARQQLSWPSSMLGQWHAAAFMDAGEVTIKHGALVAESRRRHLSGAGVGLYWTRANSFAVKAFYARKLGSEDAISAPDKSGRFWIQAVKYF